MSDRDLAATGSSQSDLQDDIGKLREKLQSIGTSVDEGELQVADESAKIFAAVLDGLSSTLKYVDHKLVSTWWEPHESRKQFTHQENTLAGNYLLLGEINLHTRMIPRGAVDDNVDHSSLMGILPPLTEKDLDIIENLEKVYSSMTTSTHYYLMRDKNKLTIMRIYYERMDSALPNYVFDHVIYRQPKKINTSDLFQVIPLEQVLSNIHQSLMGAIESNRNRIPLLKKRIEHLAMVSKMLQLK